VKPLAARQRKVLPLFEEWAEITTPRLAGIPGIPGTCLPAGRFIILLWHSSLAAQGRPVIASVPAAGL
jgi:hypothetical protein